MHLPFGASCHHFPTQAPKHHDNADLGSFSMLERPDCSRICLWTLKTRNEKKKVRSVQSRQLFSRLNHAIVCRMAKCGTRSISSQILSSSTVDPRSSLQYPQYQPRGAFACHSTHADACCKSQATHPVYVYTYIQPKSQAGRKRSS